VKLHANNILLVVDTSKINDPEPRTKEEEVNFVRDAIAHANNMLRQDGITLMYNMHETEVESE